MGGRLWKPSLLNKRTTEEKLQQEIWNAAPKICVPFIKTNSYDLIGNIKCRTTILYLFTKKSYDLIGNMKCRTTIFYLFTNETIMIVDQQFYTNNQQYYLTNWLHRKYEIASDCVKTIVRQRIVKQLKVSLIAQAIKSEVRGTSN